MERFRRGGTIGMDLDRGAIKAVQLARTADGYVLQHVGYQRLPEGAIIDGEVADSEMLAAEIRTFWDLHSFRGKSVVLGVAGRNVIVRFIDFPRLSPEDLDSAMNFQAEEHIPMPLEDSILDHIVLGPSTENPEEDKVLVVAAHRGMITGYTSTTRSGGLRPTGIDVKALSLTRSALPDVLFDNEETVLLLDVGTEISNLVVVQNRMPTLTQFIPLGFRDFANSVAHAADLDADTAEKQALNSRASIGDFIDEESARNERLDFDSTLEAETFPLEPTRPEDEGEPRRFEPEGPDERAKDEDATEELDLEAVPDEDPSEYKSYKSPANETPEGETSEVGSVREPSGGERFGDDLEAEPNSEVEDLEERDPESPDPGEAVGSDSENAAVSEEDEISETGISGASDDGEARTEELDLDPALIYDVRRGLEDAAGRLAEEVQRSVEYHNSRPDAREVSRILISGEGSLVSGLESYLGDLLGIRAERARPSEKITSNRSNISDEQLTAMEPVLAVALGLAMEDE